MRKYILLATASLLSACGGGGGGGAPQVQTPGGISLPGQVGSGHTFVDPKDPKSYKAIGAVHGYRYTTGENSIVQTNQLYAGNSSTPRNSGISIDYNPRDAIFEISINEPLGNAVETLRFQDPLHRTDHGGEREPQGGTPEIAKPGILYLQAGSQDSPSDPVYTVSDIVPISPAEFSRDVTTFFYQKPGTTTKYVTFAGFVRNKIEIVEVTDEADDEITYLEQEMDLQRGAFVFGERTFDGAVPKTGSGTYSGAMIATMVYNPLRDVDNTAPTYFQWIDGSSETRMNFAANTFEIGVTGRVDAPQRDVHTTGAHAMPGGSTFNANGSGRIDLIHTGGFVGQFQSAWFVQPGGARTDINVGGSSIDGGFFGPAANEVGGGFRIVGGTPDERVDILGAFTGARP